jgi:N-acetylglucosaminyldiphosphoundecaprenol N-acetyl-beta-D-mannosaminyltransferase
VTIHDVRTTHDAQRLEALDLIPAPRTPGSGASTLGGPGSDTQTPRRDDTQTTFKVLNFDLAAIRPDLACERILEFAREGRSREVHLCNSYTLTLARRDGQLASALDSADLNLPDGSPVAWLGRKAGTVGPVRGPGLVIDVMLAGVAEDGRRGVRHYLYGGAEGVADAMAAELHSREPRIEIVGTETPPFRPLTVEELGDLATRINESSAEIVWIGLGTPRQDYLVAALSPLVDATLVPIGAAFDFISGRIPEAPAFLHGSGFEWLYRLAREPRRLWRRYVLDGARFAYYLTSSRITRNASRAGTADSTR